MNNIKNISRHISVYQNGMNCVIIQKNGSGCLINCNNQINPQLIKDLNINVKMIICLNYRSSVNGGIVNLSYNIADMQIAAPENQVNLFTNPMERLGNEKFRLHVYDFHPDNDIIIDRVNISTVLSDGMALDFEGLKIDFFEVKGDAVGELGCVIHDENDEHDGIEIGVCADIICGGDKNDLKIPFLYRMCKDPGKVDDYHAFMAEKYGLAESLRKFEKCDILIPARGGLITSPVQAINIFGEKFEKLYQNYSASSAMNYYYPGYLHPETPMPPAKIISAPINVKYLFCNFLIISENKRGFLIDCGTRQGFDMLEPFFKSGELESIDVCYITHYHHDHVDMLDKLQELYNCKIYAPESFADMLENPEAYYMTCLSHISVLPEILPDNYSFTWEEYEFTHFEFPGQTLYHGGLLFNNKNDKNGSSRILFCGDSFCPTGFDDYCPQNRNFTDRKRGYHKCLDIIENIKPDCIINQHQSEAFVYTEKEIAFLRGNLEERYNLLSDLTIWESPDYSLDPYWVRMYPYVSYISGDETDNINEPCVIIEKELQFTNHTNAPANVAVKFNASNNLTAPENINVTLPPLTSGLKNQSPADICVPVTFLLNKTANTETTDKTYAIGAEVWLNGVYFGEICKSVVLIK